MREMLQTVTIEEALSRLREHFDAPQVPAKTVSFKEALGCTLASPVCSPENLPASSRSTVDGYAVRAEETFGASASNPVYVKPVGVIEMGQVPDRDFGAAETMVIYTGGILPSNVNAVVMLEHTLKLDTGEVEVHRQIAPGENVVQAGEDAHHGEVVLSAGTQIRSQEIGYLAALGVTEVSVRLRPRVAIISTGNEIVDPDVIPQPGQMRDVNSWTLAGLIQECGGEPVVKGIIHDDFKTLFEVFNRILEEAQIVVMSGGSSKGAHDVVAEVIDKSGKPGVFVHGVSMKPGKPVIIGVVEGNACYGLPGHPISAMLAFHLFVEPALDQLLGRQPRPQPTVSALLSAKIPSASGRDDFVRVIVREEEGRRVAEPVFGKSGLISLMVKSHGFVHIPAAKEGLQQGECVEVRLW
ncbi:MAG: molybdopterin molybdotransferase MoeA [Armatimonadetes bacterium]|nr:molybdopterin molybdotransferase MoeA [Armatimonadota bacterium]